MSVLQRHFDQTQRLALLSYLDIDINVNLNHNMDGYTVGHWRPDLLSISYHPSQFWYVHLGTLPLFNVWVNLDKHWTI